MNIFVLGFYEPFKTSILPRDKIEHTSTTLIIPRTSGRLNLKWLVPLPFKYKTRQCDKKESRQCDWEMSSEISNESSIDI